MVLKRPPLRRLMAVGLLVVGPAFLLAQKYAPPVNYYANAEGQTGQALRTALHAIIDGHSALNYYNDLPILWRITEMDPDDSSRILTIYAGASVSGSTGGAWNREHTWPQSYGAEVGSAFSDAHHIFPALSTVNETRSNYIFDYTPFGVPVGGAPGNLVDVTRKLFEPRDAVKGRVARAQLYMDLRYDATDPEGDFQLTDFPSSFYKRFGKLTTLLEWHRKFPPTEYELARNHVIYNGFFSGNRFIRQGNRNPFIDYPELADAIHTIGDFVSWGSWRVRHFTLTELKDDATSGDLSDPENDYLANLIELSMNADPRTETLSGLPTVAGDAKSGAQTFSFTRIKKYDRSFLGYVVEYSEFPLDSDSWNVATLNGGNSVTISTGQTETVTYDGSGLSTPQRARHFRLRVTRQADPDTLIEATFDPVRHAQPGSDSLFLYAEAASAGWKASDWFGYVHDAAWPWVYHPDHQWLLADHAGEGDVLYFDPALGWLWTGYGVYPVLFHYKSARWLLHDEETAAPNRQFTDLISGTSLTEAQL